MIEVPKAKFGFTDFEIEKFTFRKPTKNDNDFTILIDPSGEFITGVNGASSYKLTLDFAATEVFGENEKNNEEPLATAKMMCFFNFENVSTIEDIPSYFYKNALAIVFPYLRSFISNLTLQSNLDLMILPLLNLSSLEARLIESTKTS